MVKQPFRQVQFLVVTVFSEKTLLLQQCYFIFGSKRRESNSVKNGWVTVKFKGKHLAKWKDRVNTHLLTIT